MLKHAWHQGLEIGIFCALHTYGRQLNQHPHIHVSVIRGGLTKYDTWKPIFFKKKDVEKVWRSAVVRLLRIVIFNPRPTHCWALDTFAIIRRSAVTLTPSFNVIGKCILPKRPEEFGIM
nr:transposase [Providencia sp. PROV197]